MGKEDLGTISIGITANASQLESELAKIQRQLQNFKVPNRELRLFLKPISDDQITRAKAAVTKTLATAHKIGVPLDVTLTVTKGGLGTFRKKIVGDLGEVPVRVTADVDPIAFAHSIVKDLQPISVPLTWHWVGGPPPPGFTGGSGPGGGGGGGVHPPAQPAPSTPPVFHGPSAAPTPVGKVATPAKAPTPAKTATPAKAPTPAKPVVAPAAKTLPFPCPLCARPGTPAGLAGTAFQSQAGLDQHLTGLHHLSPGQGKVAAAANKSAQPTPVVTAPVKTGNVTEVPQTWPDWAPGGSQKTPMAGPERPLPPDPRTITRPTAGAPASTKQVIDKAIEMIKDGSAGGLEMLQKLGIKIPNGIYDITFKANKKSPLGQALAADPTLRPRLAHAFEVYAKVKDDTTDARNVFGSKAYSASQSTGVDPKQSAWNNFMRDVLSTIHVVDEKRQYNADPTVIGMKAQMAKLGGGEEGFFGAVAPQLVGKLSKAAALARAGDSTGARALTSEILREIIETNPKMAMKLLDSFAPEGVADVKAGNRGGRGANKSGLKREKGVASRINREGEYVPIDPGYDAMFSTIRGLFGTIVEGQLPQQDKERAASGITQYAARSVSPAAEAKKPGKVKKVTAEELAQRADRIQADLKRRVEITGPREGPVGRTFLGSLPERHRRFGKYSYLDDVGTRLQRLQAAAGKEVQTPGEIIDLMKKHRNYPGLARGGTLRTLGAIRDLASQEQLYYRWTPSIAKDMMKGASSGALMDRRLREGGVSAFPIDAEADHLGLNRMFDLSQSNYSPGRRGLRPFAHRSAHLLSGSVVTSGYDGEPVLDPESIKHLGLIPGNVIDQAMDLQPKGRGHTTPRGPGRLTGRAKGGLLARLAARGYELPTGSTMVGEEGEEVVVPGPGGQLHVIDNAATNIPVWLKRGQNPDAWGATMQRGKDITGRAKGGSGGGLRMPAGHGKASGRFATPAQVFGVAQQNPAMAQMAGQVAALAGIVGKFVTAANASGGGGGGGGGNGLTPLEAALGRLHGLETIRDIHAQNLATRSALQETGQQIPVRALAPASGQAFATIFGGRGEALARIAKARDLTNQAAAATALWKAEEVKQFNLQTKFNNANDRAKPKLLKELKEQKLATQAMLEPAAKLSAEADAAAKHADALSLKLRVFAANTIGIIGGTLLFGATLGAAQAALDGIQQTLAPVIERMSGFTATTATVTAALGQQIRASGGAADATTALALANTNMAASTAATLAPQLKQRGQTLAGNQALGEQIDLIHASQRVQQENAGLGGFDRGLFASTGGILGTDIGAQASTAQRMTEAFKALPAMDLGGIPLQPPTGPGISNPFFNFAGPQDPMQPVIDFNKQLAAGKEILAGFNAQAVKGGASMLQLEIGTRDEARASADIADADPAGRFKDIANSMRNFNIVLKGASKPEDFAKFLQAQVAGSQAPDASLLIAQMTERILPAQMAAMQAEAKLQLTKTIPAQQGVDYLSNPINPFGTGLTQQTVGTNGATPFGGAATTGFGGFSAMDPQATASFGQYQAVATSALNAVIDKAKEGKRVLLDMGIPPSLVAELEQLGNQAAGIELGQANRQAAFAAVQYNHQLFIMNRNLADAAALTGRQAGKLGILGRLNRENFEIGKKQQVLQFRSQTMALNLSQRQINFQKALASFQSPGETPEERAARIAQAKLEADYAQKQLDIQKQLLGLGKKQFNVGVQIFGETAQRQFHDLQFALAELGQAHVLQLDAKAADQTLALLHAREAQVTQQIGVGIGLAVQAATLQINSVLEITTKTSAKFAEVLKQTASAWNVFLTQGQQAINNLIGGPGTANGTPSPGSSGVPHGSGNAKGLIGMTKGTTSLIVGEAGSEHVAILRNPRMGQLGGGSGTTVIVDVHDNHITQDTMDALVAKISRAVEQTINRKSSLLGLRQA